MVRQFLTDVALLGSLGSWLPRSAALEAAVATNGHRRLSVVRLRHEPPRLALGVGPLRLTRPSGEDGGWSLMTIYASENTGPVRYARVSKRIARRSVRPDPATAGLRRAPGGHLPRHRTGRSTDAALGSRRSATGCRRPHVAGDQDPVLGGRGAGQEWKPDGADAFIAANPQFGPQASYGANGRKLTGAAAPASAAKRIQARWPVIGGEDFQHRQMSTSGGDMTWPGSSTPRLSQ